MIYLKHYLEILKISSEIIEIQRKNGQENTESNLNTKKIYETAFNGLINQGIPNKEVANETIIETDGNIYRLETSKIENKSMFSMVYNEDKISELPIDDSGIENNSTVNNLEENVGGMEEYEDEEEYEKDSSLNDDIELLDEGPDFKEPDIENLEPSDEEFKIETSDIENPNEESFEEMEEPTEAFENALNFDESEFNEENMFTKEAEPESIEEEVPEEAVPEEGIKKEKEKSVENTEEKHIETITDLEANGFIMSKVSALYEREGKKDKIEAIIYPLYPDKENSPQVACVVINNKVKTVVSNKDSTDINIILDGETHAIIKFNKTNGKYDPILSLNADYKDRTLKITSKQNIGNKGHIQTCDESNGTEIHVMPINFKNNKKTGNANFIYYVKMHDGEIVIGDTITNPEAVFEYNDEIINILCRWDDKNILYMILK